MPLDQPPQVTPLVVRAARLDPAPGDVAFSIVTIDPAALRQSDRLDAALASAPGFQLFRRTSSLGANPTTQGASLRGIAGSGASRALVTLDGVPQNDPFGGWMIWTALPPETLAAARLVRGAGAGPYGAGALTGVVALEQPDRLDGGLVADVSAGTLGYGRAAAVAEVDTGPSRLFLDVASETSGGWIPVIQGRGRADRPLTLRDLSAAARAEVPLGAAVLTARIAGYEEDRGAGALFAASRARGGQASLTLVQAADTGRGWRLQGWLDVSDLANTSAAVSADRNSATLANDQYATPAVGVGFNAALRTSAAAYSWEIGADLRDYQGTSHERLYSRGAFAGTRLAGGGEIVAGLYAEGSRDLGPWRLTGGARLDYWGQFGATLIQTGATGLDLRPPDRGGVIPTARIGARRALTAGLYLRAAAYSGFRPATLNELHRPFRVGNDITEANPDLAPERLYGVEAGVGGRGRLTWDADIFFNRLGGAITNVTIGQGPGLFPGAGFVPAGGTLFERQNAGAINAIGVEGEARAPLAPRLEARAAFTYTHARVDGAGQAPQLTGLRPAETPRLTVTAGLAWRALPRLTLTGQVRYEGDRFDDDQNTRRLAAGAGVDARADWKLSPSVDLYLAADNVFDARLETGRSAADVVTYDAPRQVRIGISLRR